VIVAAMTLPNLLDRLLDDVVVITPGDRADVLLGVLSAHASGALPAPAGIVLTGGLRPPLSVLRLIESLPTIPPVVLTSHDTYETATLTGSLLGRITAGARRKIDTALALFEEHVPGQELLDRVAVARSPVVTPLMFEYELLDRARSDRRHIVLPEGDDERVLLAADTLLRRGVVDLTLLGTPRSCGLPRRAQPRPVRGAGPRPARSRSCASAWRSSTRPGGRTRASPSTRPATSWRTSPTSGR
jgi:phosphate acetyltransferase